MKKPLESDLAAAKPAIDFEPQGVGVRVTATYGNHTGNGWRVEK